MSKLSRESTNFKMKGAGDGIKNTPKSTERIAVPSSRKFTATSVSKNNEKVQMELKKVIDSMETKARMKKSKTMAEITPTKNSRRKTKRPDAVLDSSVLLHATPRPVLDDVSRPPSPSRRRRRLELLVYHRMLVFVWRRSKMRQAMLSESLRRRQDQISKLEKQVECLKNLMQSECSKRAEITGELQRKESLLRAAKKDNESLTSENMSLKNEVNDLRAKIRTSVIEMENLRNELNSKSTSLKRLEDEIQQTRTMVQSLRNENAILTEKVKAGDDAIKEQEQIAEKKNHHLEDLDKRLKKCEENREIQDLQYDKLNKLYQFKLKTYNCIKNELSRVCLIKDEMQKKIDLLTEKEAKMTKKFESSLIKERECTTNDKKCWWKNAKNFFVVSWALLQNAAYIMLPAL